MNIALSRPLVATEPKLSDHGCLDRWEDEGGALMAAGNARLQENDGSADGFVKPGAGAAVGPATPVRKALTWLQYAARHTHHRKISPDGRLALTAMLNGSSLKPKANRERRFA